jgi:simple sugar transport system permease protein
VSRLASGWARIGLAIVITLLVGAGLSLLAGTSPWLAYVRMVDGAFGDRYEIAETVVRSLPLMVVALGVAPALRAGVFTVGSEGQLAVGAIVSTATILAIGKAPAFVLLGAGIIGGAIGGALWALLPGALRAYARVNEILSTLLLNYLAGYGLLLLLRGPLGIQEMVATPRSAPLPKAAMIPNLLENTRLHWGVLVALLAALALAWWVRSGRSMAYDVFASHQALARRMGVTGPGVILSTMATAGAAAGVVGWLQVAGLQGTLYPSVAGGLGFAGVLVALLGGLRPLGIVIAALFFGALTTGAEGMQAGTGVPAAMARVFEGLILLAATLIVAAQRREKLKTVAEPPQPAGAR